MDQSPARSTQLGAARERPPIEAVPTVPVGLSTVRRLRHRQIIDRLDYLRELRRLSKQMSQSEIARALGVTQPSICSSLKSAAKIADPPTGFCGASVYEIAQRFTAGELAREDLVDQLGRWQDTRRDSGRNVAKADDQLARAMRDGLLDEATYRAVLDRRQRLGRATGLMPAAAASGE